MDISCPVKAARKYLPIPIYFLTAFDTFYAGPYSILLAVDVTNAK